MKHKKVYLLIIFFFLLNLIWEFSHYTLYNDLSGIPKYPHLLLAIFTDAFILTIIFLIISIKNKNLSWINKPKKLDYLLTIIFSLVVALTLEIINLNLGRWSYNEAMPTIFGIGLSPLTQLAITGFLGLVLIRFLNKSRKQSNSIPKN